MLQSLLTPGSAAQRARDCLATLAPRHLQLGVSIAWVTVGNAVSAVVTWLLLIALARLGTPEVLGIYALATAVATPMLTLTNLSLRHLQLTDVRARHPYSSYVALRLFSSGAGLLFIIAVAAMLADTTHMLMVMAAVAVARALDSVADIFHGLFQKGDHVRVYSSSMVARSSLSLLLFVSVFMATGDLISAALGLVAASFAVLVFVDIPNATRILRMHGERLLPSGGRLHAPDLWDLVSVGLPLTLGLFLIGVAPAIPRIALERLYDAHTLGLYAALCHLTQVWRQLIAAAGLVVCPRLARHYHGGDRDAFRRLAVLYVAVAGTLGLLGTLAVAVSGRAALRILYGPLYAHETQSLTLVMLAEALLGIGTALGVVLTATRLFRRVWLYHSGTLIVTAAAAALLVGPYGIRGAAGTLVVLGAAFVAIQCWRLRLLFRVETHPHDVTTGADMPAVTVVQPGNSCTTVRVRPPFSEASIR